MAKQIIYQESAREALRKGVEVIAKAVAITLGPLGRNVILSRKFGSPQIVNDGITVANEIALDNYLENVGISLIREAASRTNTVAGDGTTTTTILAYAIIYHGMKNLVSGIDPIELKRGIKKAVRFVEDKIIEYAKPIDTTLAISQIATVSSGNDKEIGSIIAHAFEKAGRNGIIFLEESHYTSTQLEVTCGMKLDTGFVSPYFLTNPEEKEIIQNNPYILLTDQKITMVQQELVPILELVAKTNKPLLIISKGLGKEVLSTIVINKLKNVINVVAIKSPGFGDYCEMLLEDIGIFTEGKVISRKVGLAFHSIQSSMLGQARKVIITRNSTTIMNDRNKQLVNTRCYQLSKQIEASNSQYEKEKLKSRLAKLSGSATIIKVGAITEIEMKEKKLRLEDALHAAQASVEEGIIPGGGSASVHLAQKLGIWARENLLANELIGALIVQRALITPIQTIVQNAGSNSSIIIDKILNDNFEVGYDVISKRFANMYAAGIVDPAKVLRSALQNAASIATMVLTTDCVILNKKGIT